MEEESCRCRHHGGGVGRVMEEESCGSHLAAIWKHLGAIWEAAVRHLGDIHLRFSPLVQAMLGKLFCMKHYMNILSGSIPYTKPHHTRQTSKQANNQTTERTNERTNEQTNKAEHTICGTFWLCFCKQMTMEGAREAKF